MVRLSVAAALTCKSPSPPHIHAPELWTNTAFPCTVLLPLALAVPRPLPLTPDPAGAKNVGNGAGGQFITGACLSDADCASGCCARLDGGGICSGPAVSFAQGKQGCGFGGAGGGGQAPPPPEPVVVPAPPPAAPPAPGCGAPDAVVVTPVAGGAGAAVDMSKPGAQNVGKGDGSQFITGQCFSDADCASGCCAKLRGAGQCSGPAVSFDAGKQGCGFVNGG